MTCRNYPFPYRCPNDLTQSVLSWPSMLCAYGCGLLSCYAVTSMQNRGCRTSCTYDTQVAKSISKAPDSLLLPVVNLVVFKRPCLQPANTFSFTSCQFRRRYGHFLHALSSDFGRATGDRAVLCSCYRASLDRQRYHHSWHCLIAQTLAVGSGACFV